MTTYFKQLDALRFISVLAVICVHLPLMELGELNFFKILTSCISGVSLFFCISGFLITYILLLNAKHDKKQVLKAFYLRRFIRIFPIYYLTVIFLYIINVGDYRDWAINDFLYITNFAIANEGHFAVSVAPHFWSLAVEEQFYLIWPSLLLAFSQKWSMLLTVFITCTGLACFLFVENSFYVSRTFGCLLYLGSGAILAAILFFYKDFFSKHYWIADVIIVSGILLVAAASFGYDWINFYTKVIFSGIVIPALIWKFTIGYKSKIIKFLFENKVISYFGKISYGLYIYHLIVIYPAVAIKKIFGLTILEDPFIMQVFKIILAFAVASLSWEFIEKPLNKLKAKFPYH